MTKTRSITEKGKEGEEYRLADGVGKRRSRERKNQAEGEPLGSGRTRERISARAQTRDKDKGINVIKCESNGSNCGR